MDTNPTPQAARILDCAQALIATGGYNGFSYADISAQVGITKASIHHHFPKKADLVRTLVQRYREAGSAGMSAMADSGAPPRACLEAFVDWWLACIHDGTRPICICAMLAAETPSLPAEVADEVRLHFVGLAAWLEDVLSKGAASAVFALQATPAAEAQAFMAAVHGAMISARAYGDPDVFKTVSNALVARLTAPAKKHSSGKAH